MATRALIVTVEHEDERQVEAAENRIWDGLKHLHPAVRYTIEPQPPVGERVEAAYLGRRPLFGQ